MKLDSLKFFPLGGDVATLAQGIALTTIATDPVSIKSVYYFFGTFIKSMESGHLLNLMHQIASQSTPISKHFPFTPLESCALNAPYFTKCFGPLFQKIIYLLQDALTKLCAVMNMPGPVRKTSFQTHVKAIARVSQQVAEAKMSKMQ